MKDIDSRGSKGYEAPMKPQSSFGRMQPGAGKMNPPDIKRLQIRYSGKYIALWRGRVIASAANHAALIKKIHPVLPTKRLELMLVPPKGMMCVY